MRRIAYTLGALVLVVLGYSLLATPEQAHTVVVVLDALANVIHAARGG